MDVSPTERDETLRERIRIMTSAQFEQLVFELAHREHSDVRRLSPPDGGADTIRPATSQQPAWVWQAKHYPAGINWNECQGSLAASIKRWSPSQITFAFPRDLSERTERTFQAKLVDHVDAASHGVTVDLWNLSELIRRLNVNPDLRNRFFPETASAVDQIMRGVTAGGQLTTGGDLVERVRTLGDFAEQRHRDFSYTVMASAAGAPAPEWPEPPYLQFRLSDGHSEVQLMAWPRESAQIAAPSFAFSDDAAVTPPGRPRSGRGRVGSRRRSATAPNCAFPARAHPRAPSASSSAAAEPSTCRCRRRLTRSWRSRGLTTR